MYNWSVNTKHLDKNPGKKTQFALEQAVNYGLNNKKLSAKSLKKLWPKLRLSLEKKKYLESLLWPQKS